MNKQMLQELVLGIFILVFTGAMFYQTTLFIYNDKIASVGPDYWPQLILGGMLLLSVLLLVDIVKRKGTLRGKEPEGPKKNPKNFWITLIIALVYSFSLNILGFALATLLILLALLWVLEIRKIRSLLFWSFSLTAIMVVLFPILMTVPMPRGVGIFRTFSLLFY
ncbi:MAG: tripartite tricarboxylate transporter TctB family protein [Bacillota bacterium]